MATPGQEDGRGSTGESLLQQHEEKHFTAGEMVRDAIIGVSDGLTVPFALAAGLSGTNSSSSIVLTAGIAEVVAGAISMGLGGFLAAKSEEDHYNRELKREQDEIVKLPAQASWHSLSLEAAEIGEIFAQYGLEPHEYASVAAGLRKRPQAWVDFMMKFELGLEKPEAKRAVQSALTIAIAYAVGGLVPLSPYMFITVAARAMLVSVAVTLVALLLFGYVKGSLTGSQPIKSALQTAVIGAIASAAAYGMAKVVAAA